MWADAKDHGSGFTNGTSATTGARARPAAYLWPLRVGLVATPHR